MKSRGLFVGCFVASLILFGGMMASMSVSKFVDGNSIANTKPESQFAPATPSSEAESPQPATHASVMFLYGAGLLGLSGLGRRYLS